TLRQDALDRGSEATPHFERSATAGVRFTQARSASSWTWPSTASLFTGLYPNSHGVHDNARCYLVEGLDTMGEIFSLNGYTTAAFLANVLISTENNFHQGFETFANLANLSARALNERVAHWLDNTDGTTRFLYLHYFDPHTPYRAPDDHNADAEMVIEQEIVERLASQREADMVDPALIEEWMDLLRRRYDREVAYLDKAFGELMTLLEDHGILENALLVVTSDHGEEFYEHGKLSHGPHLYDETVRVPLWITGYGKAALPPKTIHIPAENKNVLPTLLQILDMTHPPHPSWGFSLLNPRQEPTFLQTWHGTEPGSAGWIERLALVGAEHKFIYTPSLDRQELFDLSEDPFEQVNRASHDSEITDKMAKALAAWNQQTLSEAPGVTLGENAEVQAWMAELGYVGGEGGN
ncbi:MAG: sulfatase, partial [Planctomycetota bacterium]|nr:sulfatase [Planctomycetota bacterium]